MYVQYILNMPPFKPPNDNDALSLKDIIRHGPIVTTAALIDIYSPYRDMAQLVFDASNFDKKSKGILREYMVLRVKSQQIKYGELVEMHQDVEIYENSKQKNFCQGRGC
jgi:hypothetical protein